MRSTETLESRIQALTNALAKVKGDHPLEDLMIEFKQSIETFQMIQADLSARTLSVMEVKSDESGKLCEFKFDWEHL